MNTIKNIYTTVLLLTVILLVNSCSDFLDVKPTDFISPKNYFNTESDANSAIAGVYKNLNSLYGGEFKSGFCATTDEVAYLRLGGDPMHEKTFNATTLAITNIWNKLYQGVYYANFFLENIDKVRTTDEKRNSFRAEARFLRGFYYYHLAMLYGDVPLRMKATNSPLNTEMAASPREVVFDSICADMEYATQNLLTIDKQTGAPATIRISREGAIGVLGRVYLSMAGILQKPEYYAKARDLLLPLIESRKIRLNPDYTQIWKNISADTYENVYREIMWDIEFNASLTMGIGGGWAGNVSAAAPASDALVAGYNLDWFHVTITLWQYYQSDKNDVRYAWNICDYRVDVNGNKVPKAAYTANGSNAADRNPGKFRRDWEIVLPRDKNLNGSNFPVLRYSDVLLMFAEAENEVNGATDLAVAYVDSVRLRAKAFLYSAKPVKPTTEELRTIIQQERSRELCFESTTRYYDLIRWGILQSKFTEVGNTYVQLYGNSGVNIANKLYFSLKPHMTLFPIPTTEMQLNPLMKQNPGY